MSINKILEEPLHFLASVLSPMLTNGGPVLTVNSKGEGELAFSHVPLMCDKGHTVCSLAG